MRPLEIYLVFNGNCEEAFNFYKLAFGVEAYHMMHYSDVPDDNPIDPADASRVLHVTLPLGGLMLMGSDAPGSRPVSAGSNVMACFNAQSAGEAMQVFERLSAGGNVSQPLGKTFWADLFAMFTDRFGVPWIINYSATVGN